MSRPAAPPVCDGPGCGKRKQDLNHWWTVQRRSIDGQIVLSPGTVDTSHMSPPAAWAAFDACGDDCALKIVSEQMSKAPRPRAEAGP